MIIDNRACMYEFQNIREENFVCLISESIITIILYIRIYSGN